MTVLRACSDRELLARFGASVARDNRVNAELLRLIEEVDRRHLWAELGHPSMFDLCVNRFAMSEPVAGQRIAVARMGRRFPRVVAMIECGGLHLTGALRLKPHLRDDNHAELLDAAGGKSVREIEGMIARFAPQPDVPSKVRALPRRPAVAAPLPGPVPASDTSPELELPLSRVQSQDSAPRRAPDPAPLAPRRFKLQVTIDEQTHAQLAQLQDLLAHQIPNGDPAIVVKRAFDALLEQTLKTKVAATDRPRSTKRRAAAGQVAKRSRAVPADIRRHVWARDQGRCGFVGSEGRRCDATRAVEFAHVDPWGKGGDHTAANLGLRCRAHNDYEATRDYGDAFMAQKKGTVREECGRYGLRAGDGRVAGVTGANSGPGRTCRPAGQLLACQDDKSACTRNRGRGRVPVKSPAVLEEGWSGWLLTTK